MAIRDPYRYRVKRNSNGLTYVELPKKLNKKLYENKNPKRQIQTKLPFERDTEKDMPMEWIMIGKCTN